MYILTIYYFLKFEVNLKNGYDKWHVTLQILFFVTLNLSKILPKYLSLLLKLPKYDFSLFLLSVDANYVHLLSFQPVCNIFTLSRAPASPKEKLLHTSNDPVFVATTQWTPPAHLICRQQGLHSQDVIYSYIL